MSNYRLETVINRLFNSTGFSTYSSPVNSNEVSLLFKTAITDNGYNTVFLEDYRRCINSSYTDTIIIPIKKRPEFFNRNISGSSSIITALSNRRISTFNDTFTVDLKGNIYRVYSNLILKNNKVLLLPFIHTHNRSKLLKVDISIFKKDDAMDKYIINTLIPTALEMGIKVEVSNLSEYITDVIPSGEDYIDVNELLYQSKDLVDAEHLG